jgi:hypothetical protein
MVEMKIHQMLNKITLRGSSKYINLKGQDGGKTFRFIPEDTE